MCKSIPSVTLQSWDYVVIFLNPTVRESLTPTQIEQREIRVEMEGKQDEKKNMNGGKKIISNQKGEKGFQKDDEKVKIFWLERTESSFRTAIMYIQPHMHSEPQQKTPTDPFIRKNILTANPPPPPPPAGIKFHSSVRFAEIEATRPQCVRYYYVPCENELYMIALRLWHCRNLRVIISFVFPLFFSVLCVWSGDW